MIVSWNLLSFVMSSSVKITKIVLQRSGMTGLTGFVSFKIRSAEVTRRPLSLRTIICNFGKSRSVLVESVHDVGGVVLLSDRLTTRDSPCRILS